MKANSRNLKILGKRPCAQTCERRLVRRYCLYGKADNIGKWPSAFRRSSADSLYVFQTTLPRDYSNRMLARPLSPMKWLLSSQNWKVFSAKLLAFGVTNLQPTNYLVSWSVLGASDRRQGIIRSCSWLRKGTATSLFSLRKPQPNKGVPPHEIIHCKYFTTPFDK